MPQGSPGLKVGPGFTRKRAVLEGSAPLVQWPLSGNSVADVSLTPVPNKPGATLRSSAHSRDIPSVYQLDGDKPGQRTAIRESLGQGQEPFDCELVRGPLVQESINYKGRGIHGSNYSGKAVWRSSC